MTVRPGKQGHGTAERFDAMSENRGDNKIVCTSELFKNISCNQKQRGERMTFKFLNDFESDSDMGLGICLCNI